MISRKLVILIVAALLSRELYLNAIKIGSETTVSIEPPAFFPAADNDNEMRGFGWFKNGFTLEDATTTCTFNSVHPVSGIVDPNGGTLYLNNDLIFRNFTGVLSGATIRGYGHTISMCGTMANLPSEKFTFDNVSMSLCIDATVTSTISIEGSCIFSGDENVLFLDNNADIVIEPNSQLTLRHVHVVGLSDTNIRCRDDSGVLVLDDVQMELDDVYSFTTGSMIFQNQVSFIGTTTFVLSSRRTSTIDTYSEITFSNGVHFEMGRHPVNGAEPIYFTDDTSLVRLDNCSFRVLNPGVLLERGTLFLDRNIDVDIASTNTSTGIIIGDGTNPANDLTVYFSPGTITSLRSGHVVHRNVRPDRFVSFSKTTQIARHALAFLYLARSLAFKSLTSHIPSADVSAITIEPGQYMILDDLRVLFPGVELEVSGTQPQPTIFMIQNGQVISITKGNFPLAVLAAGVGSSLQGTGYFLSPILLSGPTTQLVWSVVSGGVASNIFLYGGELVLANEMSLGAGAIITGGGGKVDLSNKRLSIGAAETTWIDPIAWRGTNGTIDLNADVELSSVWTFSGNCCIQGNEHILRMGTGGTILVKSGSQLCFKSIAVDNIQNMNIMCEDDTAVVMLEDMAWRQQDNFIFRKGSMIIQGDVKMFGDGTIFSYETSQTTTVSSETSWILENNFTFSYSPPTGMGSWLLEFEDNSSELVLNGSTVQASTEGLNLTKGTLLVRRDSQMKAMFDDISLGGIIIGNSDSDDDCIMKIGSGITLAVAAGVMHYRNTAFSSWEFANNNSRLLMKTGTRLRLHETLIASVGAVRFEDLTSLDIAQGKVLSGSIEPLGRLFRSTFSPNIPE